MAAQLSAKQHATGTGNGETRQRERQYAVNKTRGLAFARQDEGEWQSIDPKEVAQFNQMERVSHAKIGDNWFSIYRSSNEG